MSEELEILEQDPKIEEPEPEKLETEPEEIEGEASPEKEEIDTDELEEEEEEKVEEIEEEERIGAPPFNQLRKDPTIGKLLKEYPQIQANYFKAEKYAEFFPTIESAQEAAQKAEIFDYYDASITKGDLRLVVEAISQKDPNALGTVADTIIPILQAKNPQLYVRAVNPIIRQVLGYVTTVGDKHSDKEYGTNLKNAAVVIANMIWGENGPPAAPAQVPDPRIQQMEQQQQQFINQQAYNFESSVHSEVAAALRSEVEKVLKTETKLTPFVKDRLIETIMNDVNDRIGKDPTSKKNFEALWANSVKTGFSDQSKLSLKSAFLSRAKMIIPGIRSKRLAEALGTAPVRAKGKTVVPQSSGGVSKKSDKLSTREVREKNMSEMDIINYGAK